MPWLTSISFLCCVCYYLKVADESGWIPAYLCLGCIFGSLPSGYLTDRLGRKWALIWESVLFTFAAVLQVCGRRHVSMEPSISSGWLIDSIRLGSHGQ